MIEVKELRIGNWVHVEEQDGDRYEYPVASIHEWYLLVGNQEVRQPSIDRVFPIPLTWLNVLGLAVSYEVESLFEVYLINETVWMSCNEEYHTSLENIKYVHQWQNLHYALTGSDL